jgi:AraC-like DNA-binding protein
VRPDLQHRGELKLEQAAGQYLASRWVPSEDLAEVALYYWFVTWDRTGQAPYEQEVLTQPYPHLVLELDRSTGDTTSRLVGVSRRRFTRRLEGAGRVAGIAFQPGALFPWLGFPLARLTDRMIPLAGHLGVDARALERAVLLAEDDRAAAAALERFLRGRPTAVDPSVALVRRVMERVTREPVILRVEELSAEIGMGARALERLFHRSVGVSPKWVIRRLRLIEAARRLDAGELLSFGDLAASLGYFDQAHFTRDFKALVGRTPANYARAETGTPRRPRAR